MNKTLTINLSGLVFHIDENAYEVLRSYLEKLKRRFTGNSGEEIITDIEGRIAEMFQEKISPAKNVITLDDVNSVITVMGNPEDIAGETEQPKQEPSATTYAGQRRRRLYRNPDDKMLGGVCGGVGAYLDIDPVWFRLAFALAIILLGTGAFLYIILWIIIPTAKTASEKLEMHGEPVNVSNIEKNIRAEMDNMKDRLNKFGSEINNPETHKRVLSGAEKIFNLFREILSFLLKIVKGIVGFVLSIFSIFLLVMLTIVLLSLIGLIPGPAGNFAPEHLHYVITMSSVWILIAGLVLLIGIPLVILMLNGIKLLFRVKMDLKKVGVVMLVFWIIGISICVWQGIYIGRQFTSKVNFSRTEQLHSFRNKTIFLHGNKISYNPYEYTDDDRKFDLNGSVLSFTDNPDSVMCSTVHFNVEQSTSDSVYLVRNYSSRGISMEEARELAGKINYNFVTTDSSLTFNNAFNIRNEGKFRFQAVNLTLKIPIGYKLVLDYSLKNIAYNIDNITNTYDHDMLGHSWQMTRDGLKCLDCASPDNKGDGN